MANGITNNMQVLPVCKERFDNHDARITGMHDRFKERIDENADNINKTKIELQDEFKEFRKEVKAELKTIGDRMMAVFVIILGQGLGALIYFLMRR